MNLLLITRQERIPSIRTLTNEMGALAPLKQIFLSKNEIANFNQVFPKLDTKAYDRIIIDIPLRRLKNQYHCLIAQANLVFFEEDLCQEFLPESKFYKKFSLVYKKIGSARIIGTGYFNCQRFLDKGLDTKIVPKAYDDETLYNKNISRDIEVGFIGRYNNRVYKERRKILSSLHKEGYLETIRTTTDADYLNTLNRIKFFFSADINFSEYMFKNFEAMACGCVLVAYRQGNYEEEKLGFIDMENIILYSNVEEAKEKIKSVQNNQILYEHISTNGQKLVENRHKMSMRAKELINAIHTPIQTYESDWKDKLQFLFI